MKATAGRVWMKFPLSDKMVTFDSFDNASVGTIYGKEDQLVLFHKLNKFSGFIGLFGLWCYKNFFPYYSPLYYCRTNLKSPDALARQRPENIAR